MEVPNYVEVTVSTSLSKSFMIEVPEGYTREEILEKAKEEIMLPTQVIDAAKETFNQLGIKVYGIDFNNWFTDEVEYITE